LLKSLFGDLMPATNGSLASALPEFAATAILETNNVEVTSQGRMVDRRTEDVYFSGSPGAAIRNHLSHSPPDPDVRLITMLDPSRMWAPGVVKALSDATGQPVERLHLRDEDSEALRVTLERTSVPRRSEATLKIYHADVAAQDAHNLEAPLALMERSHMAIVIIGAMTAVDIAALTTTLTRASRRPNWRCGALLFLLPPGQLGLNTRIAQMQWPAGLRVDIIDEPMTGTSSVWNALLNAWDRAQAPPTPPLTELNEQAAAATVAVPAATVAAPALANVVTTPPPAPAAAAQPRQTANLAPQHAALVQRHLRDLATLPGVTAAGLADIDGGCLLSGITSPNHASTHIDPSAMAAALAIVAHAGRAATRAIDAADTPLEMLTTGEHLVHFVRPCVHNPDWFLFACSKRYQGNPSLIKMHLAETDRALIVAMAR
jgi:hypothetical protein